MRSRGLAVAKLAHSGVAAHLIGGQTIHHFFSLDIDYSNSTLEHSTTQTTLLMGQWTNSLKVLMDQTMTVISAMKEGLLLPVSLPALPSLLLPQLQLSL